MKIPALLMASLLAAGVSAQTAKPVTKTKKPIKKVKKTLTGETPEKPKPGEPKIIAKKDTVLRLPQGCPACGMG
ncbi:hypothetical protein DRF59_10290 [Chryseobacterium flavum]|uniref:Uncharacterized protein n=1 Tax=Chryseobacterium flavum TaxID=415851 RepID=A0A3D9CLW5_9FLAO|nr:hypothetical protein [Chryseobacterium flavum]REC66704.1 hypothetical protein DRF59_10290 [Chryseobacterium flavum]